MGPQMDLPGFYYDPDKNRYFPIKGPLPGSKLAGSSLSDPSSYRKLSKSARKHQKHFPRRNKLMESFKLVQSREIHGGHLIPVEGLHSFRQEYQKLQVSHPKVWKYPNTSFVSDSALEEMLGLIQTTEGLKQAYLLAAGGINCSISLYAIKNLRRCGDYGINYLPQPVWPSLSAVDDRAPGMSSNSSVFTSLSSSISCIKRIGRNIPNTTDNVSNCQHALVSTLGSGVSGGSLYVMNLNEPLTLNEDSRPLNRRINKVASSNCTIWTADAKCTNAAIGTNVGVSLINLDTGKSSSVYRSRSDVLSQQFDLSGNILLCGIRKGAIVAIDVRQKQSSCFEVSVGSSVAMAQYPHKKPRRNLSSCNAVFMPSAICSVVALQTDEQYFLGSSMDGSIELFDRRFLKRAVQSYEGHVNSHSPLQLGVNPSETFVLSGGEDSVVRIWSIKTGHLIFEEDVSSCIFTTVSWPCYGDFSYGHDQFLQNGDIRYAPTCSWGVWLGSREGLHFMGGTN